MRFKNKTALITGGNSGIRSRQRPLLFADGVGRSKKTWPQQPRRCPGNSSGGNRRYGRVANAAAYTPEVKEAR